MKAMQGMTLIELMVVMALVAILTTWGVATYRNQTGRVHRAEAQQFMLTVAGRQETYHLDTRRYGTLADLKITVPAAVAAHYAVQLEPDNASQPAHYNLKATPQPEQAALGEPMLQLDDQGRTVPAELWQGRHP